MSFIQRRTSEDILRVDIRYGTCFKTLQNTYADYACVTNLGCVRGQYHTNNEQTQSVEGII